MILRTTCTAIALLLVTHSIALAAPKYKITGKVKDAIAGYQAMLVQKNGATKSVTLSSSGKFSFKNLTAGQLKGASIQFIDETGRFFGPLVLGGSGSKVAIAFKKTPSDGQVVSLGNVTMDTVDKYGKLKAKQLPSKLYKKAITAVNGVPIGAGSLGVVESAGSSAIKINAEGDADPGEDSDLDGIPNSLDADDDGDLILDSADPDSEGADVPYTALFLDFRNTINSNVESGLSDSAIDAVISGENKFSVTFFFSQPETSTVDGGHVRCADSLTYCRRNTPLAFHGGVSESSSEFQNKPWSDLLNADGYPRMEVITLSGGGNAAVASIQPRVGRDVLRPGDTYEIVLTSGSAESSRRTMALAPYFASVPALKEYDAGFGTVAVDYASVDPDGGSIPGVSPGNPIVLSSSGTLTLTFWRPQRPAVAEGETGYYDYGNLNYGLVIGSLQATCGGLYSSVSSDLVEDSTPLGTGNSPLANQGANLHPLADQAGDRAANASNTITFTVDLKTCLSRAGGSANTYDVNLTAAGAAVTGGQSSANQLMYITIP